MPAQRQQLSSTASTTLFDDNKDEMDELEEEMSDWDWKKKEEEEDNINTGNNNNDNKDALTVNTLVKFTCS